MVCERARRAGAAAAVKVARRRQSNAYRGAGTAGPTPLYLSPPAAECVFGRAGGGRRECTCEKNAGRTGRETHPGAVQSGSGSGQAEGTVDMRLKGSGGDENDDGRGCEKMGSLSPPGGSVSGHRSGSHDGNTNRETWNDGTGSLRELWMEDSQSSGLELVQDSEPPCLHPVFGAGWTAWTLTEMRRCCCCSVRWCLLLQSTCSGSSEQDRSGL